MKHTYLFTTIILATLSLLSCKQELSTEFTIYESDSQAESTNDPSVIKVQYTPMGDSLKIWVHGSSGTMKSFADAAYIDSGSVRIGDGEWSVLSLDSNIQSYYYLSTTIYSPDSLPVVDVKIIDQFLNSDSLYDMEVPSAGLLIVKYYGNICGTEPSCMLPTAISSSSSIASSSSSINPEVCGIHGANQFCDPRDSTLYNQVSIGNTTWMAENLNYSTATLQGRCYNDDPADCEAFGRLYNWKEILGSDTTEYGYSLTGQGICPTGWHIPTRANWTGLDNVYSLSTAAFVFRATTSWNSAQATNSSGFNALATGFWISGNYFGRGEYSYMWTIETNGISQYDAWVLVISDTNDNITESSTSRFNSIPLRCVKNQ